MDILCLFVSILFCTIGSMNASVDFCIQQKNINSYCFGPRIYLRFWMCVVLKSKLQIDATNRFKLNKNLSKLYIFCFDSFQLSWILCSGASFIARWEHQCGTLLRVCPNIWQMHRILKQFSVRNLSWKIRSRERALFCVCVGFFVGVPARGHRGHLTSVNECDELLLLFSFFVSFRYRRVHFAMLI